MADTVPKTSELANTDLLKGSDYFWNILGTKKVTLPSGLCLVSSKILKGKYVFRSRLHGLSPKFFDLFCDNTS